MPYPPLPCSQHLALAVRCERQGKRPSKPSVLLGPVLERVPPPSLKPLLERPDRRASIRAGCAWRPGCVVCTGRSVCLHQGCSSRVSPRQTVRTSLIIYPKASESGCKIGATRDESTVDADWPWSPRRIPAFAGMSRSRKWHEFRAAQCRKARWFRMPHMGPGRGHLVPWSRCNSLISLGENKYSQTSQHYPPFHFCLIA